ncbi:MAG TPA: hypothetical protein VHD83_23845 [Puia sp.]|nr:hypothetical protein [Puia sp.]
MKVFFWAVAILSAAITVQGQPDRDVINFRSWGFSTCLTPAHGVYFATRMGEVVAPDDERGVWLENAYPAFMRKKDHSDIVKHFVKYLYGEN